MGSLKKLIDLNYDNPYTTEKDKSQNIKDMVNQEIEKLSQSNENVSIQQEVINDRKMIIKQRITDLFSQIEISGYSCVEWLLDLQIHKLKKLYRSLEDIWNYVVRVYRLKLNEELLHQMEECLCVYSRNRSLYK